jgi:hypothetical protein
MVAWISRLAPTNQGRNTLRSFYRDGGNVYVSGNQIVFLIPEQRGRVHNIMLTGRVALMNAKAEPLCTPTDYLAGSLLKRDVNMGTVGPDPNIGYYGIFSDMSINRQLAGAPIETITQPSLLASAISKTRHDLGFVNHDLGNAVFPNYQDTSVSGTALNSYLWASYIKEFNYNLLFGMLNAGKAIDLALMGGMQISLKVSNARDFVKFAYADTKEGVYSAYNALTGYDLDAGSESGYGVAIINPYLYVVLDDNVSSPAETSFPFTYMNIREFQMSLGLNQDISSPLANNLVRSIYICSLNKNYLLDKPELGTWQWSSITFFDLQCLVNSTPQIYLTPTQALPAETQQSISTSNAFLQESLNFSRHQYRPVYGGEYGVFNFDQAGNGFAFSSVQMILRIRLNQLPETGAPYDQVPEGATLRTASIRAPWNVVTPAVLTANYLIDSASMKVNEYYYPYLTAPLRKYQGARKNGLSDTLYVLSTETKTAILRPGASTQVSAANTTTSIPSYLNFNQAAPTTPVERESSLTVDVEIIVNPPPGTVGFRLQKPTSGLAADITLFFRAKPLKAKYPTFRRSLATISNARGLRGANAPKIFVIPCYQEPQPDTNETWNCVGYSTVLGNNSWLSGLTWYLPNGVPLSFPDLVDDHFMLNYGINNQSRLNRTYWTQHMADGYWHMNSSEGRLMPYLSNTAYDFSYPQWWSVFPYYKPGETKKEMSDFPIGTIPLTCLQLTHSSVVKQYGVPYTNNLTYLEVYLDTTGLNFAHVSAGLGYGVVTSEPLRWSVGRFYSFTGLTQNTLEVGTTANVGQKVVGYARRRTYGWELDVSEVKPFAIFETVYMQTHLQMAEVASFAARGINLTFPRFDRQYRQATYRNALYPSAVFDEISTDRSISISGKRPSKMFLSYRPLAMKGPLFTVTGNDNGIEPVRKAGDLIRYEDQARLPWYAMSTSGARCIATPWFIGPEETIEKSGAWVPTYNVLMDQDEVFTFQIGDTPTNMIQYKMTHNTTLNQASFLLEVNGERRVVLYDGYSLLQKYELAWSQVNQIYQNPSVRFPPEDQKNVNKCWASAQTSSNLLGRTLVPTRFVVPLKIPDQFLGGERITYVPSTTIPTAQPPMNWLSGVVGPLKYMKKNLVRPQAPALCPAFDVRQLIAIYAGAYTESAYFDQYKARTEVSYPTGTVVGH